ncbi:MAG: hypothetical protein ACLFRD_08650 [Nitriliruptoraceae bacterium]
MSALPQALAVVNGRQLPASEEAAPAAGGIDPRLRAEVERRRGR